MASLMWHCLSHGASVRNLVRWALRPVDDRNLTLSLRREGGDRPAPALRSPPYWTCSPSGDRLFQKINPMPDHTATALAHPNIAFVKYWGNQDNVLRLPANASLSLNLGGLETPDDRGE